MLQDSQFHCLADAYIEAVADEIEKKDTDMVIDIDIQESVLTIILDSGAEFVLSKHSPSQQLWLSSPFSGGLHYDYNMEDSAWELQKDGSRLSELLAKELHDHTDVELSFEA